MTTDKLFTPEDDDAINRPTDTGKHYRFEYKGIKLDPFRIAKIYGMESFALMTVLKKILCAGNRGHKDYKADILDCITALQRELEIVEEDENASK